LDLDIGRHHLTYERSQPSQGNNEHLVLGYNPSAILDDDLGLTDKPLTARFPRAALAAL
jgi:hypothetical protein